MLNFSSEINYSVLFYFRLRSDSIVNNRRRGGRLQRSNSTSSIAARLGVRRNNSGIRNNTNKPVDNVATGRRRLNRSNSFSNLQRNRSNSRARSLSRTNSNTNLSRSNSRSSIRRTNSQIDRQLSALQQKQELLLQKRNQLTAGRNPRRRIGTVAARGRRRSASVNARLGPNRTNPPIKRGGGRLQGRIGNTGKPIMRGRIFRNSVALQQNAGHQNIRSRSRSRSRTR